MSDTALPQSQEDRETYLSDHGVRAFISAVKDAPAGGVIVVPHDEFGDEPTLRAVAMAYAEGHGEKVTFADPIQD